MIAPGSSKSMGPKSLVNWGAHTEDYPTPYFTVAAAIGKRAYLRGGGGGKMCEITGKRAD